MKRLLLTGASGFLGWNICNEAQAAWKITGAVHNRDLPMMGIPTVKADLCNEAAVRNLFLETNPQGVIHTAAQSNPNYCQLNRVETHKINVDATILLAKLCAGRNIPFVFTSSDLVFDGKQGNYKEEDEVNPVNVYGEQKVWAEEGVKAVYPVAAICRMPLMFGDGGPFAGSFIQPFLEKMRMNQPLDLFYDEYRSAVGGRSAARGLLLALDHFHGLYHMGGRERLSRYDFGVLLKQVFELPGAVVNRISQREVEMPAPRPADVSLNSEKAYCEGYDPLPAEAGLIELRSLYP